MEPGHFFGGLCGRDLFGLGRGLRHIESELGVPQGSQPIQYLKQKMSIRVHEVVGVCQGVIVLVAAVIGNSQPIRVPPSCEYTIL